MNKIVAVIILTLFLFETKAQSIHQLTKEGGKELVFNLIEKNNKLIDTTDDVGYTPLHWALIRENWDIAKLLIGKGADVNIQGTDGGLPLHCAANHENTEIIELLIKEGAQIDVKNLWGNTPLCLASQRGCNKTVQFLISKGADFSAKSNEGWTALHYAYKCGHKEVQKILIQAGASDTIKDSFGKVPSDYTFERPVSISINPQNLMNYVGYYNVGGNSTVRVFISENKLMMEEYAVDEIYPIAPDQFYDYREPWKVRFFRNVNGDVDKIAIDFQRQTIVGKKVKSKDEVVEKPRLGIKVRPVNADDLNDETLRLLFLDEKANANAQIVTFVQEGSVSFSSGLKENDIILEFNNVKLLEPGDLFRLLYDVKPNSEVPVKILRGLNIVYIQLKFI
jgi:ankyrin repeat protein